MDLWKSLMVELKPWERRLLVEYWELENRIDRLGCMLNDWERGELDFTPDSTYDVLADQYAVMCDYRDILSSRIRREICGDMGD